MCEFISWKEIDTEKGKEILFLTAYDIFSTKRGRQLQKHTTPGDFVGHGAIAFFYEIDPSKGINRECTDFSDPKYFPDEIVAAIKAGKFRGLGNPEGLLTAPAWKAYQEATATAWKAYLEAKAPAWKAYQKATAAAEKAYQEATAPARKAYQEAKDAAFWDLFADPKNRNPKWR